MTPDPVRKSDTAQAGAISRRGFLAAAAVTGPAALVAAAGAGPARASARVRPRERPAAGIAAAPAGAGLVGATVEARVYPAAAGRAAAAKLFDGYVSLPAATAVQKVFFNEGEWPAGVSTDLAELAAKGCKFVMCFQPSRKLTRSERSKLKDACELFQGNGITFDVVLWQEPNDTGSRAFPDGAAYVAYHEYYRPYVPSGLKVIYDASGYHQTTQKSFYPGDDQVDMVYCDFYGSAWASGRTLDTIIGIADRASPAKPFGIGEFGRSGNGRNLPTRYQFTQFVDYLTSTMTARLNDGKVNGDIMYFDGRNAATWWNIITSAADWKTPHFQSVYNALSSAAIIQPGGVRT